MKNMGKVIFENISSSESTKGFVAKMSNPQNVEEYIAYHIYIPTLEYQLKKGESYCTDSISRNFSISCSEKQKAEDVVERVRGDNMPSRRTCLFVCDFPNVRYWYNYFEKHIAKGRSILICRLKLTGLLFWTYADYFTMEAYWNPDLPPIEREGLFEGKYEVEEVYNNVDYFPQ
ncbi:MAG: hypothetical protein IKB37_02810 [Rikenellaceae bacterium]|nr:hypothetical protein [Rikenellaceae bacterium]